MSEYFYVRIAHESCYPPVIASSRVAAADYVNKSIQSMGSQLDEISKRHVRDFIECRIDDLMFYHLVKRNDHEPGYFYIGTMVGVVIQRCVGV